MPPPQSADAVTQLAMSTVIDRAMQQVVTALRDNGLWADTLLVFSSDNGGPGGAYPAVNVPLRGVKVSTYTA